MAFDLFKRNRVATDISSSNYSNQTWYWVGYISGGQPMMCTTRFYSYDEAQSWARGNLETMDYSVFPLFTGDSSQARQIVISKMMRKMPSAAPANVVDSKESSPDGY
jgi:hypothetical protein